MAFPEYVSDTIVDATTYTFTSVGEINLEFSTSGEAQHTDDIDPNSLEFDQNNLTGVDSDNYKLQLCQRVTSEIMEILGSRYTADILYRIPRIREIATYMACYKLSGRRGNPKIYEEEYINAMDSLEGYRTGTRFLDAPSNGPRAIMQSYIVDMRSTRYPIRVIPEATTDVKTGQKVLWRYPFPWL